MEGESVNVASVFRRGILRNALTKKAVYFFIMIEIFFLPDFNA